MGYTMSLLKMATLLKKLGKLHNFKIYAETITDEKYQTKEISFTSATEYAIVQPAKYSSKEHEQIERDVGEELVGRVKIFCVATSTLKLKDRLVIDLGEYEIIAIEDWIEYKMFLAQRV